MTQKKENGIKGKWQDKEKLKLKPKEDKKDKIADQIEELLNRRQQYAEVKAQLTAELAETERELKEIGQELEGVMRANKIGMPGKENKAYEIGEVKLKIVEGENRWVKEKELLPAMVPLFNDQPQPVTAAKKFLAKYTEVKEYSYVRVSKKKEEKDEENGDDSNE